MFSKEQVLGVLRHILTSLGGTFIGYGWISEDQLVTIVSAIAIVIGVVWSLVSPEKKKGNGTGLGVLLTFAIAGSLLVGCADKTNKEVVKETFATISKSCVPVAILYDALTSDEKTPEVESDFIKACRFAELTNDVVQQISATAYSTRLAWACVAAPATAGPMYDMAKRSLCGK